MLQALHCAAAAAFLIVSQAFVGGTCFGQVNPGRDAQGPTGDMNDELRDLLWSLRRLQTPDFAVEVRLVSVGEQFFDRLGVNTLTVHNEHRQPIEIVLPPGGPGAPPPIGAVVVGSGRTLEIEGLEGMDLTKLKLRRLRGVPTLSDLPLLSAVLSQNRDRNRTDRSLLVVIRPRIVVQE